MDRLAEIQTYDDIFPEYHDTPIGRLLEYHNLNREHDIFEKAELLIGMCIDNRENLQSCLENITTAENEVDRQVIEQLGGNEKIKDKILIEQQQIAKRRDKLLEAVF